jgi:hypothetical protein
MRDQDDDKVVPLRHVEPPLELTEAMRIADEFVGLAEMSLADAPMTVGEVRAQRDDNSRSWTPRDALVAMLRDIDKGEIEVEDIIICWRGHETASKAMAGYDAEAMLDRARFYMAGKMRSTVMAGLLEKVKIDLLT